MLGSIAAVAVFVAMASTSADVVREGKSRDLEFEGNLVFQDAVYEVLLDADRRVVRASPERLASKVQDFLHRAGYELATVTAETSSTTVKLLVDEGRLERVVLSRENGLLALAVQLAIDLPQKVFNRPLFDSQLKRLDKRFGVKIAKYEIKRVSDPKASRLDAEDLGGLVAEHARWELHLEVDHSERSNGVLFELAFRSPAGLITGIGYRWWSLFKDNDEFKLRTHAGLRVQDLLQDSEGRRFVSRGFVGAEYNSGGLMTESLGIAAIAQLTVENRQRQDLNINAYTILVGDLGSFLQGEFGDGVKFRFGGGVEQLRLLSNLDSISTPPRRDPNEGWRPYMSTVLELDVDPSAVVIHAAKRHDAELDARWYPRDQFVVTTLKYAKGWGFDWDRFDLGLSFHGQFGNVPFIDEISAGEDLVGVFGAETFTNTVGTVHLEYRFSLIRDLFAVSVFHGVALFEEQDRVRDKRKLAVANAFGSGIHALLYDSLDLSLYLAGGLMTGNRQDLAVALALRQAF